MTKKTKKKQVSVSEESKKSAREKIVNSMLNLCNFTITVPLSDKTKNIRTDTFIYLEPLDFTNTIKNIYNSLTNKSGIGCRECKFIPYRHGYWYVEQVKIEYGSEQKMTLTLSPLPSVYQNQQTSTSKVSTNKSTLTKSKKKTTAKTNIDDKTLVQKALDKVGKRYRGWNYHRQDAYAYSDRPDLARKYKTGDCWAASFVLAQDLNKEGVTTRIKQYATSLASNHRSVQYRLNKKWYNFPYREYGVAPSMLSFTSGVNGGYVFKKYKGKT